MKPILRVLKLLCILAVTFAAFFIFTQDLQIFPSLRYSTKGTGLVAPPFVEESRVLTSDKESIVVWRMAAQNDRKGTVIFLHGNGDTRASSVGVQQILSQHGLSSYSFDYRGVQGSTGWPTEEGIYLDGEAVVDFAAKQERISARELIILGVSIGTGPAAYLAQRYDVTTVALVSPYERFDTLVGEMPLFGLLTPFLKYSFPTIDHLRATSETRIIIAHGTVDTIIPYAHTQRIETALSASHSPHILRFEGYGHNDILPVAIEPIIKSMLGVNENVSVS